MLSVFLSFLYATAFLLYALPFQRIKTAQRILLILLALSASLTIHLIPSLLHASDILTKICYSLSFQYRMMRASNGIIDLDAWCALLALIAIHFAAIRSKRPRSGKALICIVAFFFALQAFNFTILLNDAPKSILTERLNSIDQQIRIQWHRSSTYAAHNPHAVQIEQILREIDRIGGDKIRYSMVQTESNSTDAMLRNHAIEPVPLQQLYFPSAQPEYSALEIELNGASRVISPLSEPELVYYEIIAAIDYLASISSKSPLPAVAIVYGGDHAPHNYPYVAQALASGGYAVEETQSMPGETGKTSLIILIGSSRMSERDAIKLHEFIKHGGKAIVCTTPHAISFDDGWTVEEHNRIPMDAFLEAFGISPVIGLVRDERSFFMSLPELDGEKVIQRSYEFWPRTSLTDYSFIPETSHQEAIQLFWPSALTFNPESHPDLVSVLASSPRAHIEPLTSTIDPLKLINDISKKSPRESTTFTLAVRSVEHGMLVIADELFLSSMTDYTASSANFIFLRDSVDALLGRSELTTLKKNPLRASLGFPRQSSTKKKPIIAKKQMLKTEKIGLVYPGISYETLLIKSTGSAKASERHSNGKALEWSVSINNELTYSGNEKKIKPFISDLTKKRVITESRIIPSRENADNYCVINLYEKNHTLIEQITYYPAFDGNNNLFYYAFSDSYASSPDRLDDSVYNNTIEWTARDVFADSLGHAGISYARLEAPGSAGSFAMFNTDELATLSHALASLRSIDITNMLFTDPYILYLETDDLRTMLARIEYVNGENWHLEIGNNAAGWIVSSKEIERMLYSFQN